MQLPIPPDHRAAAMLPEPIAASSSGRYYGWTIVLLSALALVATAPGQTAAVSAFIDPMMASLGIGRAEISAAYLVGTLLGALAMPWAGRLVDRFGVRRTMAPVALTFGVTLIGLALVEGIWGVTLGFLGIRMLGQGALALLATTAVALWFSRRRGLAIGIVLAVGGAGISLAPLLLERLIAAHGWQVVWAMEGLFVWAVVLPIALFGMRDHPSDVGQHVDGTAGVAGAPQRPGGVTRARAVRTPIFWVITASVSAAAMLTTAVAFHQIDLLGERGLRAAEAAGNFLPQTVAALAATTLIGILSDRVDARYLLALSTSALAAGLAWGVTVVPGLSAVVFGVVIGVGAGGIRALEAATIPRYFGLAHLGSIRGVVVAVGAGASAFGPILFAVARETLGSYGPALLGAALLPLVLAVAALVVTTPQPFGIASSDAAREPDPLPPNLKPQPAALDV